MDQSGFNPNLVLPMILIGIVLLGFVWFIGIYNRLVGLRNNITESWSNVDTELRRRHDLIPNLVETVKGYAAHERAVFEAVAEARSKAMSSEGPTKQASENENMLVGALKQLFAVSEGYPTLKADQNFLKLQQELVDTEDRIQAARRFFNGNIRDYNVLVQSFPSALVAGLFAFTEQDFFEIDDLGERAPVSVGFHQ
jgi:LemA protein